MLPKLSTLLVFLFCFALITHAQRQPETGFDKQRMLPTQTQGYTYKITGDKGVFGYDVLKDSVMVMRQPPAAAANPRLTLKTTIQATRAANVVIYKLQHNIQPVNLTTEEMKKVTIDQ